MDIPTDVLAVSKKPSPQPEAHASSPHAGWHKNPHYLIASGIFLSVYIAFNIWLYNRAGDMTLEKFPVLNQLIKNPWARKFSSSQTDTLPAQSLNEPPPVDITQNQPDGNASAPQTGASPSAPTKQVSRAAAMIFACDPQGICNIYDKPKEKGCPQTFADSSCSNKCTDKSKRCKK